MRAAERRAERLRGQLDPPVVLPLDEAANICRIADLPELYSHLSSGGIVPGTMLQSYEQGVTVWGERAMAALRSAATKKIIGPTRLARDLTTLARRATTRRPSPAPGSGWLAGPISCGRRPARGAYAAQATLAATRGTAVPDASAVREAPVEVIAAAGLARRTALVAG